MNIIVKLYEETIILFYLTHERYSSMIKAIIFDMDGVLIDAKEWHYTALNKALELFGLSISREEHIVTFDGLPTKRKLEMLTVEKSLPSQLHPFINELKQEYTLQLVHLHCRSYHFHRYALSRLKREGMKLVVASNSVRYTVELMMKKSCLLEYLDFFLSNQDVIKGKPDPEIYNCAISRLSLDPRECLIIEDNLYGVQAARDSGAHVMVVQNIRDVNYWRIKSFIESLSL